MNISKVLTNGDGSINEANVSAFLRYHLDPKADHTLGSEFLKRFLEVLREDEESFEENLYDLDYQIFYEQTFREENNAKQIVDLVIFGYPTKMDSGKESLIHDYVPMWIEDEKSKFKVTAFEKINNQVRKAISNLDGLNSLKHINHENTL